MRKLKIAALVSALLVLVAVSVASAQVAYGTPFATSITYLNVGTAKAQVQFNFYNETTASAVQVNREIEANAGSSLFVGGLTGAETLPSGFKGSAVLSANQPIVATLVQIAQPSATSLVKNRPLSNGFSSASDTVLLATVLKNKFNFTSVFSIQNAEASSAVDMTLTFFDADTPSNPPIVVTQNNVPVGAAKYFDMGKLSQITAGVFNGSATVTAVRTGTTTPANIVGSSIEQQTNGLGTYAFEGVTGGSPKVFVATALCQIFGVTGTSYAIQNVDDATDANVNVTFKGTISGNPVTKTASQTIAPGAKASFQACATVDPNFTGAATIESNVPIVVIAKVFGGLGTAWLGEPQGSAKLALPYVRYSDDANFDAGKYQRAFIAIQNVSDTTVNNVTVDYVDKNGTVLGTHTIASIAAGAKANSNATLATPVAPATATTLLTFGNPESNPGGGFGGGAIVQATGGELIAVVRVQSKLTDGTQVAEDYNGIAVN